MLDENDSYFTPTPSSRDVTDAGFRFEIIESQSEREIHERQSKASKPSGGDRIPPVLLARVSDDGISMIAWCPFCRCEHYHGTCGDPTGRAGEGHRVAHCFEKYSPFKETGYILKLDRHWEKMRKATNGAGVKSAVVACDHTWIIDQLEKAMDQYEEVGDRLKIVARALFNGGAR